jgi:hypothetical protein
MAGLLEEMSGSRLSGSANINPREARQAVMVAGSKTRFDFASAGAREYPDHSAYETVAQRPYRSGKMFRGVGVSGGSRAPVGADVGRGLAGE